MVSWINVPVNFFLYSLVVCVLIFFTHLRICKKIVLFVDLPLYFIQQISITVLIHWLLPVVLGFTLGCLSVDLIFAHSKIPVFVGYFRPRYLAKLLCFEVCKNQFYCIVGIISYLLFSRRPSIIIYSTFFLFFSFSIVFLCFLFITISVFDLSINCKLPVHQKKKIPHWISDFIFTVNSQTKIWNLD